PACKEDGYLDNARRQDLEALRALPGVRAATNTYFLPWQGGGSSTELRAAGSRGEMLRTQVYNADEGTLAALGVGVTAGRAFTAEDVELGPQQLRELRRAPRARGEAGRPGAKI